MNRGEGPLDRMENKMRKYCNATNLKLFAVVLMVLDHVHQMFYPLGAPVWLTAPGRMVFPIFLFLAADSFHYTHDRKRYLKRLLVASWSMTVLGVVLGLALPNPKVVLMNNAFATFFIAALYMLLWDRFVDGIKERRVWKAVSAVLLCLVPVVTAAPAMAVGALSSAVELPLPVLRALAVGSMLLPNVLLVEGGVLMVALGVAFYLLRRWRWAQVAALLAVAGVSFAASPASNQWMMAFAAVPMLLYNGEKGRGLKNFFYVFYPAHIAVLYIVATLLMRVL